MKKEYFLLVAALLGLPGCGGGGNNKNSQGYSRDAKEPEMLAYGDAADINSFFNEDTKEFEATMAGWTLDDPSCMGDVCEPEVACMDDMDEWEEDISSDECDADRFKTVCFEKDGDVQLSDDQEDVMDHNITFAKKMVKCHDPVMFIVSGDAACDAECFEGERSIFEKRAQIVADQLVAAGVPKDCVRVVARDVEPDQGRDEVCIDWIQA